MAFLSGRREKKRNNASDKSERSRATQKKARQLVHAGTSALLEESVVNVGVDIPDNAPDSNVNYYYLRLARRFRLAQTLTIIITVIFIVFMTTAYSDDITADNIKYLFRDINIRSQGDGAKFMNITYNADPTQDFSMFRGELVYVTGSGLTLYGASGGEGLKDSMTLESPVVKAGEKYMLVFDISGTRFSVYNSFSRLYSEELDYNITSAAMSDSGAFAIVTSSREYNSVVLYYDNDFDLSARYSKSRYVTGVAVSDDGTRIAIAAMDAKDGDFLTDLTFYQPGLDSEISRVELTGTFPVSVDYMEGGFALLTLSGIYWYDIDGNAVSSYEFSKVPFKYSVSDIYYIVIIPKNIVGSVNQIVIFSSDGKQLYEGMIEERITDIAVSDYGFAYVLTQGQAIMIDIENNTETSVPISMQAKKILPAGEGTVLLAYSSRAVFLDFKSQNS